MVARLAPPRGHGYVRKTHGRLHVGPDRWHDTPATDYWIFAGNVDPITSAGATNISGLSAYGWTTTSLVFNNPVTADFLSSADDTPPNVAPDLAGDSLISPMIFGNYSHRLLAAQKLGYMPNKLLFEAYAAFTTATTNEDTTHIGFYSTDIITTIYSDGVNFIGDLVAAGIITLALVDNAYHIFGAEIDVTTQTTSFYIDRVFQGSGGIQTDLWPARFNCLTGTVNRWALSWAHVWYE